jgi:hypothetical protein
LYVIRSRFIEAKNRYYGFDFAPAFWGGYRIRQVPVVDASPGSDLRQRPQLLPIVRKPGQERHDRLMRMEYN